MMLRATRSVASRTVGLRSLKQTSSMGRICTAQQHAHRQDQLTGQGTAEAGLWVRVVVHASCHSASTLLAASTLDRVFAAGRVCWVTEGQPSAQSSTCTT